MIKWEPRERCKSLDNLGSFASRTFVGPQYGVWYWCSSRTRRVEVKFHAVQTAASHRILSAYKATIIKGKGESEVKPCFHTPKRQKEVCLGMMREL